MEKNWGDTPSATLSNTSLSSVTKEFHDKDWFSKNNQYSCV